MSPTRTGSSPGPARGKSVAGPFERETAALAKAIAHPARIAILRILLRRGDCVCGRLVDELPLAQATVSQHLRVLKEAGLIDGTIDGPRVCYCVNRTALKRLQALIGQL